MSKIVLLSHGLICTWLPILASRGLDIHHVAHRPWDRSLWVSICYRPNLYIKRKLMLCRMRKSMLTSLSPSILPFPNGIFCMTRFQFFSSKKVARRARSACRATFSLSYTPQRAISLIIHELQRQKDAKFFTFFHFSWHLEAGIATILLRISWGTIPLKISKRENQGKLPKNASEGTYLVSLNSNRDWRKWAC